MTNKSLAGKRVAITGGARGIGRSTAEELIARGAQVVIGDIDAELVGKTAAEIAERTGGRIAGLPLDVTDSAKFEAFFDAAETELGGLDVLINNAGIMPTGPFLEESEQLTDRQIGINLCGVIIGSKLAGKRFGKRGSGHIVNIASVAGVSAAPGVAVYCATKHAVVGLGSALHQELAPLGVHVTTIAPGFVRTELIAGLSPNKLVQQIGVINPEDVADAIARELEKATGGLTFVPRIGGFTITALTMLPENLRNRVYKVLGLHAVTLDSDETARAAYRARTEA
ncbi:SDR family NAD(P)-dependent oxidoreductase [Nocardia sp. SYP-A9097]|uniref:SDR family oxidoreductase n=1 Tax=Nocardia sp. SYP-A9097 TaxID=2663237 RepID=UPI00129AC13F|nr:SDR family oxidoreductase [Nocardia sp. SYP-A9097]MRH90751.1 SDR family NAD(P)-dependent oxidoreductase [Nocardia sp. SYP-A9097]